MTVAGHNRFGTTHDLACPLCAHAAEHGWWGDSKVTHCSRGYGGSDACHRTWSRTSREAHCTVCHRHFSSPSAFDRHFGPGGEHRDPAAKGAVYAQRENGTWFKTDPRFPAALTGEPVSASTAMAEDSAALAMGATS